MNSLSRVDDESTPSSSKSSLLRSFAMKKCTWRKTHPNPWVARDVDRVERRKVCWWWVCAVYVLLKIINQRDVYRPYTTIDVYECTLLNAGFSTYRNIHQFPLWYSVHCSASNGNATHTQFHHIHSISIYPYRRPTDTHGMHVNLATREIMQIYGFGSRSRCRSTVYMQTE